MSLAMKDQKKQEEKEYEAEILRFQKKKEQLELERKEEELRIKEAKQKEVDKMIERQTLALAKADNTEQIRLQRAYENSEK